MFINKGLGMRHSASTSPMLLRLVLTSVLTVAAAHADIVFSNITTLNTTTTSGFDIDGTGNPSDPGVSAIIAEQFTAAGNFALTDAEVVVGNVGVILSNGASSIFNVSLYSDSGGSPGSLIEQIGFGVSASGSGGEVTADSIAMPVDLTAGTSYWLVLTPDAMNTEIYWSQGTGSSVPTDFEENAEPVSGSWASVGESTQGQMEIDGSPLSAVPEPSSVSLLTVLVAVGLVVGPRRSGLPPK
jgi:hypothetical protein